MLKQAEVELTLSYKTQQVLKGAQTISPPHGGKTSESPPGRTRLLPRRQPATALMMGGAPWGVLLMHYL